MLFSVINVKKISVYYWDNDFGRKAILGKKPNLNQFLTNYRKLVEIPSESIMACDTANLSRDIDCAEAVFELMQGEKWSPLGEAKNLIQQKGLTHTSMSVGDIIEIKGKFYIACMAGFEPWLP
jgi:hypothetical protein